MMALELQRQLRPSTPSLAATMYLLKTQRRLQKIKTRKKQKHRLKRAPKEKAKCVDTNGSEKTSLSANAFPSISEILASVSFLRSVHKPRQLKQLVYKVISVAKSGNVSELFGLIRKMLLISLQRFPDESSVKVRRAFSSLLNSSCEKTAHYFKGISNKKAFRRLYKILVATNLFKSFSNSVFWLRCVTTYQRLLKKILPNLLFERHRKRRIFAKKGLKSVIRTLSYRHQRFQSIRFKLLNKCLPSAETWRINFSSVILFTNFRNGLRSPLNILLELCQIVKRLVSDSQSVFGSRAKATIIKVLNHLTIAMSQILAQQGRILNSFVSRSLIYVLRKVLLPSLVMSFLGLRFSASRIGVIVSSVTSVMFSTLLIPTASGITNILIHAVTCKTTRTVVSRGTRFMFKVVLPLLTSASLAVLLSPSVRHVISWAAMSLLRMPVHCVKSSHMRRALIIALCGIISVSIPVMTYLGSQTVLFLQEQMPSVKSQGQHISQSRDSSSIVPGLSWMKFWSALNFTDIVARVVKNALSLSWDTCDVAPEQTQNPEHFQAAFTTFNSLQQLFEPGSVIKLFTFVQDYVLTSLRELTSSNTCDMIFVDAMASGTNIQLSSSIHDLVPPALWSVLNYPKRLAYPSEDDDSVKEDYSLVYSSLQSLICAILKILMMPRLQDLLVPALQGALAPAVDMISSPKMDRIVRPTKQLMKSPRVQRLLSPAIRVIETTGIHKLFDRVASNIQESEPDY